ncbi:HPr family phosphocarrier protein [Paenibacillus sp. D2_2]|uniref:HPr family phosphocarrier protein n=1 Tax=Paenibacillus sp. D2_2 TaxID=3073092 RepID=UPI0028168E4E|nr:HPr family phosphocarrier protein [Paenibacillus sp. D2_2]WMT40895.1 HPr family phosphocarrier protein [Paenibacillus sp. D2_2]
MKAIKVIMPSDGFHVLLAKQISGTAATTQSEIRLIWEDHNVISDAKSILGVMAMEAKKGTTLTLTFDGPDEEQALELLVSLFEEAAQ